MGILVKTHFRNTRSFATHGVKVLSTGRLSRELYLKSIEYYRLNIFFDIRILLKIRIWHCTHVCYNRCKFGCDRNVIKDALIEKLIYLRDLLSVSIGMIFLEIYTLDSTSISFRLHIWIQY